MASLLQKLGWVFAALFLGVVILGYIPGVTDDQGLMFGLFHIDPIDDILHLGSAIWAAIAAWHSFKAIRFYFRWFGGVYLLDGIIGTFTGNGILDLGIVFNGISNAPFFTKLAASFPHILIGGAAVYIGFILSKKIADK